MNINLEALVEDVQLDIVNLMDSNGLRHISDFVVKIKEMKNETHLACYRGSSVFMSKAIFWVNEDFLTILKDSGKAPSDDEQFKAYVRLELWKTLIHEVGHSVADLLRFMARREQSEESRELVKKWIGYDEEGFAEDFIWLLQTNQIQSQGYYPYYLKMIEDAF